MTILTHPIKFALLTSAAILLSACGGSKEEPARTTAARAMPIHVSVQPAATASVADTYEATGTVRAAVTSALSARIMGHIREVRVQAGDTVRAGQVVAVLDAREIETGVQTAEAARNEAQAGVPEADNAIAAAKAQLELADATWKRMKTLHDQRSITEQEMDEVTAKRRMAQASLEMAQARRRQLDDRVRQSDAALARVSLQKSYAVVTAPFAGVVIERKAEPGMLASPGTPIAIIEQAGNYRFEASVEERMLARVKPGMKATLRLDAMDRDLETRVVEVVPSLDAASRTFIAKLAIPAQPNIRSGLFGRAYLTGSGTRNVLSVPVSALIQQGQVTKVFTVDQGMARSRLITTGLRSGANAEVLSGLTEGERVIAPVPPGLADGARVEVKP